MSHVATSDRPWTIGRLLDWTARYLADKGSEFPRLDTEVLLAHALGCKRIDLYTRYEEVADEDARTRFKDLIRRRIEGCPVAYLVGRKEFYALPFEVGPAVLIPRPETEFVVLECLRLAKGFPQPRILDIGTGSGNIPVSIAQQHKSAVLTAVDLSPDALAIAERNARTHGVDSQIRFLQGDLFSPVPAGERFDFILSNPPYIAEEDLAGLPVGVRDYEPHVALNGGPGGFRVFDSLVEQASQFLAAGGFLIVEIGAPQEERARNKISAVGFELNKTLLDGSGHPRVLSARSRSEDPAVR